MNKKHIENIERANTTLFEKKLHELASIGELDFSVNKLAQETYSELEPLSISDEELQLFYRTVKKASQEKALKDAIMHLSVNLAFGRLLQFLREKSGLAQIDIARLLHKDKSYVENLETCQINPLKIHIKDLVNILELYHINISQFIRAVKESTTLSSVKTGQIHVMARSTAKAGTKERGVNVSHALDSVLLAIAKKEGQNHQSKTDIDHNFIDELRKELTQRGSIDLLS